MNTREERKIIITMSPKELRHLADKMERVCPQRQVGASTFVDYLHHKQGFTIDLHFDQEYFHNKQAQCAVRDAFVICCNDKVVAVVLDSTSAARDKMVELKKAAFNRCQNDYDDFDDYSRYFHWHVCGTSYS